MLLILVSAVLGTAFAPPARATVNVDQGPLIIQRPQPPNIVLMLDDSGSMAWDYMPDLCYLHGVTCDSNNYYVYSIDNDAMRDANNNGVYYNPSVTYDLPPRADGSSYPNSPGLGNAYKDGFRNLTGVDVTTYSSPGLAGYFDYYTRFTSTITYAPTQVCRSGDILVTSGNYAGMCAHTDTSNTTSYYAPTLVCNGSDTLNTSGQCQGTRYIFLFTYTTGPAAGPYVRHYVGKSQSDCAVAPAGTCDYSAATQQNVANWFSYYRTRMLMAKSGLMNSFSRIDPLFRIGYGSIHGNNNVGLGASVVDSVQKFGDGSSGTQRASFWSWLISEYPSYGTPLRKALQAVGEYYTTSQPWLTDPSDSTSGELACRQSYTILTTDGFWNGSSPNVGNVDGSNGTRISGPNGQNYTYTAAQPYADGQGDTLADVAMKYWVTDLRPNTSNEVPTNNEDPAFWQHMSTFTLGLGFTPVGISPAGTTIEDIFNWAKGGAAISGFSWPVPSPDSINNIADLAHAAVDGHGGFYSATTPQAFTSGLQDALKRAAERVGTGASLAANSTELKTGTVAYQANYYTGKWKGDLKALAVNATTGAIATNPTWTAANALPAWGSRNIWTYNPTASNNSQFTPFNSLSNLSTAEVAALGTNATDQQNMLNYLRGDPSNEQKNNGTYRNRDTALGDIVDSQPVYVGAPDPNQFYGENFTGEADYGLFATNNETRTAQIYVAANDGMLHAFDAATGVENFAFLPASVLKSNLAQLADPNYGVTTAVPHQYFNDGELTIADAYINRAWHSVLVGTTGRGPARTVYALDVTDPANITLLWERSAGDGQTNSDYIGEMTGKPVIAQTADGTWSVLVGNGYNSSQNKAALLQFDLATGDLTVHATDSSTDNGLAAPVAWIDTTSNGVSTEAYAGDLHGNVWSFDLGSSTSRGTSLFIAKDGSGNPQPITAGMLAGKDPSTGNVWLFFGTGRYLSSGDLTDTSTQSWYGIIVQSATTSLVSNLGSGRSALVQRQIIAQTAGDPTASPPILPARVVTPLPNPSDMTGKSGWYMDLLTPVNSGTSTSYTAQGERMVTANQFEGNLLLGTTRIPQASDLCNPSGSGFIMAVDPFTGTNPPSSFFDINGNGQINSGDNVTVNGTTYAASGVGFNSLPNNPIFVGGSMLVSFDNGSTGSINTSSSTGSLQRVSWRELINQ